MLALYTLGAGLIVATFFLLFTLLGGWITRRVGPTPGLVAAGLIGTLAILPMGTLINFFHAFTQATGRMGKGYYFCFTAGVGIPVITGLCCSLLLLFTAMVALRKKQRRSHQRS
jgi:hypothetical protein